MVVLTMRKEILLSQTPIWIVLGTWFAQTRNLRLHQLIHTGKPSYACDKCRITMRWAVFALSTDASSAFIRALVGGRVLHAAKRLPSPPSCLHTEKLTRTRRHVCEVCGKEFSQRVQLQRHELIHTGVRPYACDHCDGRFIDKDALMRRIMKSPQQRSRWTKCATCGETFTCASDRLPGNCRNMTRCAMIRNVFL